MEDVRELLAEYGQCHSTDLSESDRHRLLRDVVVALIRRTDAEATVDHRAPEMPAVFFELAGRDYAITVVSASGPDVAEAARAAVRVRDQGGFAQGVRWVLVCARTPAQGRAQIIVHCTGGACSLTRITWRQPCAGLPRSRR
jgi:hypothetical protein